MTLSIRDVIVSEFGMGHDAAGEGNDGQTCE